ncbi:MAG: SMC family ATPase [Candidatus Diapherotrites archaeon]|nr:SMC family ATPase [Candidatus Diapherotrites archaeon]
MIRRVLLENWKSHAKSEFEFEKGTNVLVGVSGSGKTSVMDAICFALYGTFPQAAAREIKLEEVIRQQPTKSDFCKVTVEFEYGKKNFELTRTIFRNSSNQAVLKENGSLMAGPKPAEVSKRVEEIIEVNYDLFTRAIYSEQNQIDYFLKLNPAQRKEKIDDLLLLNKYELVRANAVNMQNRLKKQLEDKTMWLEELKEGFDEKALEEVLKKILEKQTAAEFSKKEKIFLEAELKKVLEQISELEKKMKEFLFYKELLIKVGAGAAELQKTILYTKKKMDKKSLTELLETEKNLLEKIMEKKKQAKELEKEQKETQNKTSELLEKKGALEEKVAQKIKQAKELKSSKGVCPVCNRKLEEHLKGEQKFFYT